MPFDEAAYRPTSPIVLREHDATWSAAFDEAARELASRLGGVVVALHHVGSTAIAAIAAKPVIDILAVVTDLDDLDQRAEVLATLGYEGLGEFGIPRRRYFRRNSPSGTRTHQVHAFASGHEEIERMLLFRDYLRAMPAVARRYQALKYQLAARCGNDIETYAGSKTDFVAAVLSEARPWANEFRAPGEPSKER